MRAPAAHDPRDPVARVEREALECMLQVPHLVPAQDADGLDDSAFEVPAFRAVHAAVRAAGGMAAARGVTPSAWAERVREEAADAVRPLVTELAVTPLPADGDEAMARYAASVVLRMVELQVTRRIGTLRSRLQRMSPDDAGYQQVFTDLLATETERRSLRERIAGG
jgi:DNA primase